jgi:HK97 family phage major capsid protein
MPSKTDFVTEQRDAAKSEMDKITSTADMHKRSMSKAEKTDYEAWKTSFYLAESELMKIELEERTRAANGAALPPGAGQFGGIHTSDASIYTPTGSVSYFGDLYRSRTGDSEARERLARHTKQRQDAFRSGAQGELRAISATTGAGGEFIPPLWLEDDYIAALRPARATADILTNLPLPEGTDLMNIPKIATGATTALQATQNTGISQTDITTSSIPATVFTIAGGQTFSNQLFEQSPVAGQMDKVILSDLMADYARQVGSLVINGTGTGQPFGLLNVAGITSVTYTDATPAFMGPGKLYAKIGQGVQAVQTARYLSATAIVMHPRRWAWAAVQVDSSNRAVILPDDNGPLNASGIQVNGNAQGIVGKMFGLPVVVDPNIPINLGAGTNQDPIIILKADDTWLYESSIRAEVFPQTYANTMSMFARVYNYMAMATRLGQSIAVINGTGLATPTF